MTDEILFIIGGIVIGVIIFTIAYRLVTVLIFQEQKQAALLGFSKLHSNIQSVCLQEFGNTVTVKVSLPDFVRVVYATNDTTNALPSVINHIKNEDINSGYNLCLQLKKEQEIRCQKLDCNTSMPYIGAMETYNDLQLLVNKILGKPMMKEYTFAAVKTERGVELSPPDKIYFDWPVDSHEIASCFGWNYVWDDDIGNYDWKISGEINISVEEGSYVKASADGIVISTGISERIGNYIVIKHSAPDETKYYTSYYPLKCNGILVNPGEIVSKGDIIGLSGGNDECSGNLEHGEHLRFRIEKGERSISASVNPCLYLKDCLCSKTCKNFEQMETNACAPKCSDYGSCGSGCTTTLPPPNPPNWKDCSSSEVCCVSS